MEDDSLSDTFPLGAEASNQLAATQQPIEALLRSLRKRRTKKRGARVKRDYRRESTPPIEAFSVIPPENEDEEPLYDDMPDAEVPRTSLSKPWKRLGETQKQPKRRTFWRHEELEPWDPSLAPKYAEEGSSTLTNGSTGRGGRVSSPSGDDFTIRERDLMNPFTKLNTRPGMQACNPRHFNGRGRPLKRFSIFWRKDYDVEKQVAKGEVASITRLIRRDDNRYDFEKKDALKMDKLTRKFCLVFFVPPGAAALLVIYLMANNFRIQEELQRRYNSWLHADLLFDLSDSLEDFVGRITLKSVSHINVQNLAMRLLRVVNSQLQEVRGALIIPPDLVKDEVCNMFLRNRGKEMLDTRRKTDCCFFIRKLPSGNVRMVVGGHSREALEKAMVLILNRMNPLVASRYDQDTLILQECDGAYRCILKQFADMQQRSSSRYGSQD